MSEIKDGAMILCCGEALIDMIPSSMADGRAGFVPHAGGAIFNTAIALGRLGAGCGLVSGISQDQFGDLLMAELINSKVDTRTVVRADRPSTMAYVHLVDGSATYSFHDENTAGRLISIDDVAAVAPEVDALFFGGISLAVEPCADTYAALLAREGGSRAVMLDPNIRPSFIRDAATYRARLNAMFAQADVVKLSDEDLEWLMPEAPDMAARAAHLVTLGVKFVIVTLGGDGALGFLSDGIEVQVPANKTSVVDTVGAGDTFNAGVLAKLSQLGVLSKEGLAALTRDQAKEALTFGAKVAAVTVSRAGANPPWASELR